MRKASQISFHAGIRKSFSSGAQDVVDSGWVEATETLCYELNPANFGAGALDEDGIPVVDICHFIFSLEERARLVNVVEKMRNIFPFPSFTLAATHASFCEEVAPTFHGLLHECERSLRKIETWKDMPSKDRDDVLNERIDCFARALALRSGFLRLAAELNAFLLQESEQYVATRNGKYACATHRRYLIAALEK